MKSFITAFAMVFLAEMGDKTQLFLIGLSSKYKIRSIIIAVVAAIAVLNGGAVALGFLVGGKLDVSIVKAAAGVLFLIFAYTSLFPKKDEKEGATGGKGAVAAIFAAFFLAELGDKTQLMTLTLSAESSAAKEGFAGALYIFIACSLGLIAADLIGIIIGYFLAKKLPQNVFTAISFAVFTFFGLYSIYEAASALSGGSTTAVVLSVGGATLVFAALCAVTLYFLKRRGMTDTDGVDKE